MTPTTPQPGAKPVQRVSDETINRDCIYADDFAPHDGACLSAGYPLDLRDARAALAKCNAEIAALAAIADSRGAVTEGTFQERVQPWMMACFGPEIAGDREERNHRFLEEALELVQAKGCARWEALQLVDYVFDRPIGEPAQEVGGVMVTLAALCLASHFDMHQAGEIELARIWTKVEKIRAKQAAKPKHSPLPEHALAARPTAEPDAVMAARLDERERCARLAENFGSSKVDYDIAVAIRAQPAPVASGEPQATVPPPLRFTYRNHRGEVAERTVQPISVRYGITKWHPEPGWLLLAFDLDKQAEREFSMDDIWTAADHKTPSDAEPNAAVVERERCAKIAENMPKMMDMSPDHVRGLRGSDVAAAIRAPRQDEVRG